MERLQAWAISFVVLCVTTSPLPAADLAFAHELYRDKRYQLAADEYQAVLKDSVESAKVEEANFYLAECQVQLNRSREAVESFEKSAAGRGGRYRAPSLFRIASLRQRLKQPAEAAAVLRSFLDEYPKDVRVKSAWCLLVECLSAAGDGPSASSAALQAERSIAKSDKLYPRLQLASAKASAASGAPREAEKRFRAIAEGTSAYAEDAGFALGELLFSARDVPGAERAFLEVARRSPESPLGTEAAYNAAVCACERKEWDAALARLAPLVISQHTPKSLLNDIHRQQVAAYIGKKDWASAKRAARSAATAQERQASELLQAWVEVESGESAAAQTRLKPLLAAAGQDSQTEEALALASRAEASLGNANGAQRWMTELVRQFPQSPKRYAVEMQIAQQDRWRDDATHLGTLLENPVAKYQWKYRQAFRLVQSKMDAEAEPILRDLLQAGTGDASLRNDGSRADVQYLFGAVLARQKRWLEAGEPLAAFIVSGLAETVSDKKVEPSLLKTAGRWYGQASAHSATGFEKTMAAVLRSRHPHAGDVQTAIAEGLVSERAFEAALACLNRSKRGGLASTKDARVLLARCLLELKRPKEALETLPVDDASAENVYLRGVANWAIGSKEAARTCWQTTAEGGSAWSTDAALRLSRAAETTEQRRTVERLLRTKATTATAADEPALRFELAVLAADLHRSLEAASELKSIAESVGVRPTSQSAAACLKLAEIFEGRKEFASAQEWLDRLEKAGAPTEWQAALTFRRASLAFRRRMFEAVEQQLADFDRRFPQDGLSPAAKLLLAENALERQRPDEAVQRFEKLLTTPGSEPYRDAAEIRLAQALLLAKKWAAAHDAAERYLATPTGKANSDDAWFVQGRAMQQQAKFDQARQYFEQCAASASAEMQTKARFMIGETYFHQSKHDHALREYLKAALLGGAERWQASALLQAGKCHEVLGDGRAALQTYQKVVERFPKESASEEAERRSAALSAASNRPK